MKIDVNLLMNEYNVLVEGKLNEYLKRDTIPLELCEAMSYSVFAGGKRLRPALLIASNKLFSGEVENALPYACAIEMIHTYSLIHDDLPAMDNDDYRRGRLTSHKVFGEDKAILVGDGLLSYAFDIMIDAVKDKATFDAMKYISYAAGVNGMVAGQWVDVSSNGLAIDKSTMEYIHLNKTAAMIIGAVLAGASCGGASENEISLMGEYAKEIGYTFQIVDDILDVCGDSAQLGKATGSDAANNKTTYVTLYGIDGAKKEAEHHTKRAIEIMQQFGDEGIFFIELAEYLLNRVK